MLCIFPSDETLNSFNPLIEQMDKEVDVIKMKDTNMKDVLVKISMLPDNVDVLFIGHGASHCLYGTTENGKKSIFINSKNIEILKNKNIIALACRSSEFLKTHQNLFNNYLGFGNIPSDWEEVLVERNLGDTNYLTTLDKNDLQYYVNKIATISSYCLINFLKHRSFKKTYLDYLMNINRCIYELSLNKERENFKGLIELFFDTKNDITFKIR
jgi:hypothetical protein